jgi:hypothetical protein
MQQGARAAAAFFFEKRKGLVMQPAFRSIMDLQGLVMQPTFRSMMTYEGWAVLSAVSLALLCVRVPQNGQKLTHSGMG